MGTYWKVSKNVVFSPQERGEKRGWEIIRAWSENAATEDYFARFPPLSMPFFTRWDWKCGQSNTTARKLCLQGWTQPLQRRLYCRLPFSPQEEGPFQPPLHAPAHRSPSSGGFFSGAGLGCCFAHSCFAAASRSRMEGFFSGCVRSACSLAFSSSSPRLPLLITPSIMP